MDFKQQLNDKINMINKSLNIYVSEKDNFQNNIYKAMRYSLFAGGKRLRPIITLASCEIIGEDIEVAIPMACAIEMIHTYSLIHDDLPSMDNDDYRRGKPTNHKVFGEAMSILAGDALLTKAFEVAIDESINKGIQLEKALKAVSILSKAAGTEGMIGGQVVDLECQDKVIDKDKLIYMHNHKTSALIRASAQVGAIISGADTKQLEALTTYGKNIGLAFQIKDDILDIEGDSNILGKSIGSDVDNNKSTFISIIGIAESKVLIKQLTDEAVESLSIFKDNAKFLINLANLLINRER